MSEALPKRLARLFSARVGDAVDRMEAAASESVMREAIREVDRAVDLVQAEYEAAVTRRLLATRQQKTLRDRALVLEEKARFALGESRADLAEAALTKQVELEEEADRLEAGQAGCREEETRLAENLASLRARKDAMELALEDLLVARRDAELGGDGPTRVRHDIEQRVQHSEQAFRRAMFGVGGVDAGRAEAARSEAATANRVAEIDVMRKRATVASRMSALRQDMASV